MTEEQQHHYRRHRFPAQIIAHAVWLYYRFPLSFRDVEDLLAEGGIEVSFQTLSEWVAKFGPKFANQLRRRSRGQFANKWQLDEMVVSIKGRNIGSGGPLTPMATYSMRCCKAEETSEQLCR